MRELGQIGQGPSGKPAYKPQGLRRWQNTCSSILASCADVAQGKFCQSNQAKIIFDEAAQAGMQLFLHDGGPQASMYACDMPARLLLGIHDAC